MTTGRLFNITTTNRLRVGQRHAANGEPRHLDPAEVERLLALMEERKANENTNPAGEQVSRPEERKPMAKRKIKPGDVFTRETMTDLYQTHLVDGGKTATWLALNNVLVETSVSTITKYLKMYGLPWPLYGKPKPRPAVPKPPQPKPDPEPEPEPASLITNGVQPPPPAGYLAAGGHSSQTFLTGGKPEGVNVLLIAQKSPVTRRGFFIPHPGGAGDQFGPIYEIGLFCP